MAEETYYTLLEISEIASAAEIKTAYLRLIREVHPDRVANAPAYWLRQAEEKSKEINEAYTVLSNHEKRRQYDSQLAAYRGSRSSNGQPPSQAYAPPTGSSAQQHSQTSSRPQYGSAPSAGPGQPQNAASTSVPPTNAHPQSPGQPFASSMSSGQRLYFALAGCLFAFGGVVLFWDSTSIGGGVFSFLFAASLLFGVACLYQRQISRMFSALGVSQPKHQLVIVICAIVLVLFGGKIADTNRDTGYHPATKMDAHDVAASSPGKTLSDVLTTVGQVNDIDKDLLASVMDVEGRADADEARRASVQLNAMLVRYQDNIALALAAYKGGPDAVDKYHGIPPDRETRAFVSGVIHEFNTRVKKRETHQPSSDAAAPPPGLEPVTEPIAGDSGTKGKRIQDAPWEEAQKAEARWQKSLIGTWVGKYSCAQGVSGLTLTIVDTAGEGLSGTFDFYPVPGGYHFQEGSYSGAVTAAPGGSFEFKPQRWISHPPGFIAVALSGNYKADAQRLQGHVTGATGCTSFDLSRVKIPAGLTPIDENSATGPDKARTVSKKSETPYDAGTGGRTERSGISELQSQPQSQAKVIPTLPTSNVDRASIESACSGARLVQGAAAYHRCLDTQVEELARYPDAPDLSRLSSVDRTSIESACSGARLVQGAAAYHRCLDTQVEELAQHLNAPDLSRLSSVDRASIESACSGARLVQGPAAYHQCLNTQIEELAKSPITPDLSGLSSVDRSSIESACSGARLVQGAAAYHRCLKSQVLALMGR